VGVPRTDEVAMQVCPTPMKLQRGCAPYLRTELIRPGAVAMRVYPAPMKLQCRGVPPQRPSTGTDPLGHNNHKPNG